MSENKSLPQYFWKKWDPLPWTSIGNYFWEES